MISLKSFVSAIHTAVSAAADTLINKNQELLSQYFQEVKETSPDDSTSVPSANEEKHLQPLMVKLNYPDIDNIVDGKATEVMVPLITLVPFTSFQIEKVTLSTEFRMYVDETDELQLDFSKPKRFGKNAPLGKLNIVISPTETPEGLQQLIDGYQTMLKRQL